MNMASLVESGRLYSCVRCHELVVICRACDRGNIYCFGECSRIRRMESKRRANKNYRLSLKGKLNHMDSEARRRARRKEEMGDHGPQEQQGGVSLVSDESAGAN